MHLEFQIDLHQLPQFRRSGYWLYQARAERPKSKSKSKKFKKCQSSQSWTCSEREREWSPLEQTPWGGLLHLPQSLHGEDLNHVHNHTGNLKHSMKTCTVVIQHSTEPSVSADSKSRAKPDFVYLRLYLIHKHFQRDGHIVDEVIYWKKSLEVAEIHQR